jgi:CTP:molybdopterin cytidylyltransferase MocA
MITRVDVVVLAGGGSLKDDSCDSGDGDRQASAGPAAAQNKALLPIGGRPMVDYVIQALKDCPVVANIVLAGDDSLKQTYGLESGLLFAPSGDSPLGSLTSGAAVLGAHPGAADWVLACTGDIPFLTAGAVSDFIDRCNRREADFYYPINPRQAAESRFPGVRRTYAKLRDGVFTGGNLFLVRRSIVDDALPKAEDFIRLRKKPVALARLVGFGFLFAYVFGFMTLSLAERKVSALVGYRGAAVISGYAEIGVDVDKTSDLAMARRLLAP